MEDEQIIPTAIRSKIPHTLSYPVGAKIISEALVGVPQFSDLTVEFWFWNQLARNDDSLQSNPGSVFRAAPVLLGVEEYGSATLLPPTMEGKC
jgi:hypothetical protein